MHACTGWFELMSLILEGAVLTANSLHAGDAVLVHCSDGWDRTAQVCATAQLLLDPFYRTLDGFGARGRAAGPGARRAKPLRF